MLPKDEVTPNPESRIPNPGRNAIKWGMARGWESKSIEAQQEAAADKRTKATTITSQDAARLAERATLSLARTRALGDLQRACAPAHRAMLEQAIADLDRRLAVLENPNAQIPNTKSQETRDAGPGRDPKL